MLIVAIPKSCSTSLASTFANINNLAFIQTHKKQRSNNKCKSNNLYKIHSDMIEYEESEINNFVNSNKVYKQHIFPSENFEHENSYAKHSLYLLEKNIQ